MRTFLNQFIGRSVALVNICSLATASLLFVAPHAQAMPHNASSKDILNAVFNKSSPATMTRWAVPSPSCATRTACVADTNFKQEFTNFVNFIHTQYPDASVPSAARLQRHACNTLSAPGSRETDDLESPTMGQWLVTFLSYSYWSTQPGMNPYATSPVWWCFLDNNSHYFVGDTTEVETGAANIIASFDGLGKPAASGGQGFYVNQAIVTDAYPIASLESGVFAAQTFTNKELIAIDVAPPGTTKPLAQYQLLMKLQSHTTYPRRTIASVQETINKLATIEWLGLCSEACTNCAPGTVCPSA